MLQKWFNIVLSTCNRFETSKKNSYLSKRIIQMVQSMSNVSRKQ